MRGQRSKRIGFCRALLLAGLLSAVFARGAAADFGFKQADVAFSDAESQPSMQAGGHPAAWVTQVGFDTTPQGQPDGALKDLRIRLPAGLVSSLPKLPRCSRFQLDSSSCPAASAVGSMTLETTNLGEVTIPLYNVEPYPGLPGLLGVEVAGTLVLIRASLRPEPPYEAVLSMQVPADADVSAATVEIAGSAANLVLPRSCTGPLAFTFEADSWEEPERWISTTAETHDNAQPPNPAGLVGCDRLSFSPELTLEPSTELAGSPSGLDLSLVAANAGFESTGLSEADLSHVEITLPAGVVLNPAAGAGLEGCSAAEIGAEALEPQNGGGCPNASKVGEAEAWSPALEESLSGPVYVAGQDQSAGGGLEVVLYLVLRNPDLGILVKQRATVEVEPGDGRLRAVVDDVPQYPLSRVELHLRSGPRAPLALPRSCGSPLVAGSVLTGSSGPVVRRQSSLGTPTGCTSVAFQPTFAAGTVSNDAGGSAPLVLDLSSDADEESPTAIAVAMPTGFSADLGSVPACPQDAASSGACPSSSRVGYARIAIGTGTEPLWVPAEAHPDSSVFLAGSYRGAPYSFLISVPATAGPFDLGPILVRAPLSIDPESGRATLSVESLPQMLQGIPLRYRTLRIVIDRPGFVRLPTSCQPKQFGALISGADGSTTRLTSPFQAADCGSLPFRPRISTHLLGGLARNGHPALRAELRSGPREATIAAAAFTLPRGELLDLRHVGDLCAREEAPARCPKGSRIGDLRLTSPLLGAPLAGAIYLRAPGRRLPDLLADLHGGEIGLRLRGHTATGARRLRVSFGALPDLPFSSATLSLLGGRRGIVVNSGYLCGRSLRMRVLLRAHNGKRRLLRPRLRLHGRC
jgi:hypothetical protein